MVLPSPPRSSLSRQRLHPGPGTVGGFIKINGTLVMAHFSDRVPEYTLTAGGASANYSSGSFDKSSAVLFLWVRWRRQSGPNCWPLTGISCGIWPPFKRFALSHVRRKVQVHPRRRTISGRRRCFSIFLLAEMGWRGLWGIGELLAGDLIGTGWCRLECSLLF